MQFFRATQMICVTLAVTGVAEAQTPEVSTEIGLYGFGVAIGGETQVGDATMDIDLSTGDVLDALDGVFLGYIEHQRGDWLFLFRSEYMDLGFDSTVSRGPVDVDTKAGFSQWTHQGFAGYRFREMSRGADTITADVFGGLRYVNINMDVDSTLSLIGPGVDRGFKQQIDFLDPVIAVRGKYTWSDEWGLAGWIDLGGFGLGSNYSTTVEITVDRQFSNGWRVFGGWKYFTFEYEDDTRFGDLKMTPTYMGPTFGASYRF